MTSAESKRCSFQTAAGPRRWYHRLLQMSAIFILLILAAGLIFLQITGWHLVDIFSGEWVVALASSPTGDEFAMTESAGPDTEYSWDLKFKSTTSLNWTPVVNLAADNYRLEPGWATMTYDAKADVLLIKVLRDANNTFCTYKLTFDGTHTGTLRQPPVLLAPGRE